MHVGGTIHEPAERTRSWWEQAQNQAKLSGGADRQSHRGSGEGRLQGESWVFCCALEGECNFDHQAGAGTAFQNMRTPAPEGMSMVIGKPSVKASLTREAKEMWELDRSGRELHWDLQH